MPEPFEIRTYTGVGGVPLVADVGGDPARPAVILLHGGGQTRHSWGTAMRALVAHGYHVINLDTRGHGDSGWSPKADYRLATLAADLRIVIDTLPAPPALVGASMGGATSLVAVGTTADPIARALVMVDVVPRIEAEGANKIGAFMRANPEGFATLEEAADAVSAYYPHRPRPKDVSGLMKNLRRRDDGRLYWHWDPRMFDQPELRRGDGPEPPRFVDQMIAACAGVHVPTLLVRGMQSDIVGENGIAEFRRYVPHLEVFDVADAGHMVAGDRNDAFNQGVIAFLEKHLPV